MKNIEGIILAAGMSSRAQTFKMTMDIQGKTLIERCIEGMYDICSRIIVIGGHRIEELGSVLVGYPKVDLIFNPNYHEGMFSSVKEGLHQTKGDLLFLTPGDYPMVTRKVYEDMLKAEGDIILPSFMGQTGHPVLMKTEVTQQILQSSCNHLREFIFSYGFTPVHVQEPGILIDVDTPSDYQRVTGSHGDALFDTDIIGMGITVPQGRFD